MKPAEKARRTLLAIEIPRDELAVLIAASAMGVAPPPGATPAEALAQLDAVAPGEAETWRRTADTVVRYVHRRINEARQPS